MSEPPDTLEEFVKDRRDRGRPTTVLVNGKRNHLDEMLQNVVDDVTDLLLRDGGSVIESEYDDLESSDVAIVNIDAWRGTERPEDINKFQELSTLARAYSYSGIVAKNESESTRVSSDLLRTCDAIVEVAPGGIDFVGRIKYHPGENAIFKEKLEGVSVPK